MASRASDSLKEYVQEEEDGQQVLSVPAGAYKGWIPRALYSITLDALYLPFLKLLSFPVGGTALGTLTGLKKFHAVGNYLFRLPTSFGECCDLTELNLGFNHFTEIPPAVYCLRGLEILDLQDNDLEEIDGSIGKLVNLRILNLGGNCLENVPEELGQCRRIQSLNLSGKFYPRGGLRTVPLGVCRLGELRDLDLSWQHIEAIPDEFGNLRRLRALNLKGNHLMHVTPELSHCTKLTSLDLTGALRLCSEIPEAIFFLEDLHSLSLAGNFFTEIPAAVCGLRKLRVLNVQRNALLRLHEDLFALKYLEQLILGENYLDYLPPGISKLQRLVRLDLGYNRLTSLPEEICNCRSLRAMTLSYNHLTRLPENIYFLSGLQELHLDNNRLTTLPLLLDRMEGLEQTGGLYLYNNQLRRPPQQICDQGVKLLFSFLKDLRTSEAKHRRKMILIGAVKAGKTSLRNALMLGHSRLTAEHERTWVMERHLWEPESDLRVQILDFGGHHIYSAAHHMFLTPEALHVLVFDVAMYRPEEYDSLIGDWLDAIMDRAPGAAIMIVGTHSDLVSEEDTLERIEDMLSRLHREENEKKSELQAEIERIMKVLEKPEARESGGKFGDIGIERLQEKLSRMQRMLNTRTVLPESIQVVSCAEALDGIDPLRATLVDTLKESEEKPLPESWWKFLQTVQCREERILHWDQTMDIFSAVMEALHKSMISLAGSAELSLEMVLKYLHNTGEIVWYHDNPKLRNIVFHRPETLVEMLRAVFRHDFEHIVHYDEALGRAANLTRNRFQGMKEDFLRNGLMTYELLLYVLLQFALSSESLDTFISLMLKFDLCYEVKDVTSPVLAGSVRILQFPWFFPKEEPKALADRWESKIPPNTFQLCYELRFASKGPPNFFEKLSVRLASLVTNRLNWKDGVLAELNHSALLIQRQRLEDETSVTVTTRGSDLQELWFLITSTRRDMLALLQEWPFIRFEINFVCPHCMLRGLGAPYLFVGDVLETPAPKNMYWASGWCKREEDEKIPVCFVYPLASEFQDDIQKHVAAATEFLQKLYDKPDGAGNSLLSTVGLADVAANLGVEWTFVVLTLGVTQAQIEQIQMSHPHNAYRCIHTALCFWRDSIPGEDEEKIAKLFEVLESENIGRTDLSETLRERYNIG